MKCAGGRSPPRSSKCVINFLLLSYWCRPRSPELFCFHSISPDDRHVIREHQLFARLNDFLGGFRNIRTLTVIQPATYHRMSTLLNKGLKTAYTYAWLTESELVLSSLYFFSVWHETRMLFGVGMQGTRFFKCRPRARFRERITCYLAAKHKTV